MEKKTIMIIGIGLVVLILVTVLVMKMAQKREKMYFTEQPETWIDTKDGEKFINVRKATVDKTIVQGNKIEYLTEEGIVPFFTYGYFRGYPFTERMTGTIFGTDTQDMMRIAPQMDPDDGVIEGYIVAREEERKFVFYIYVDKDWKEQLEKTNILISDDFSKVAIVRQFDFSLEYDGIYLDKVEDADWYTSDPRAGGLMVGEVDKDTPKSAPADIQGTFMLMR